MTRLGLILLSAASLVLGSLTAFADDRYPSRPKNINNGDLIGDRVHDQARSKRSVFITLVHATTKSFTNFSFASTQA